MAQKHAHVIERKSAQKGANRKGVTQPVRAASRAGFWE
jgi:hypothetical protein